MIKKISNNNVKQEETITRLQFNEDMNNNLDNTKFIEDDGQEYYGPYTLEQYIERLNRLRY